jgi:ABC-2 type transport system permease protein
MKRLWAIFLARNLEFFRDRGTFFWNLFFPLFIIFGLYFAFSGNKTVAYKVGTVGEVRDFDFMRFKYLQFVPYEGLDKAMPKLTHHQIDMIIDFNQNAYYINELAVNGYLIEKILSSDTSATLERKTVTGRRIRHIDWFVPGVIGMNIMFGCLMGVGFVIVRYRKNGVLKRFKATPLKAIEFIIAQMLSRFFIMVFMTVVLYVGTNLFLHYLMLGSYLDLMITTAVAIFCLISLGLLFSTRIKSEEFAGGVLNLVIWPMMFLSGIWFSMEGTPRAMQVISQIFPVTHFLAAARQIMLDGATLLDVMDHLGVLLAMTAVFLTAAAFIFKWE